MVSDDMLWQILDKDFCSFKKSTIDKKFFCGHQMNVSGICCQKYCPLANSVCATVIEKKGKILLCMKSVERKHLPSRLWRKIELDGHNAKAALATIDKYLQFWDKKYIYRCKYKYSRIWDYLERMRKIRSKPRARLITVKQKIERRLRSREKRAESVANIEKHIKSNMLDRLRAGLYQGIYNFEEEKEVEEEEDYETDMEDKYEDEIEFIDGQDLFEDEKIEDIYKEFDDYKDTESGAETGDESSDDDNDQKPKKRRHFHIEYEDSKIKQKLKK